MLLPEPRSTRWDLHWRMFGSEVRIRPLFWASCVLLGILFYRDPDIGGMAMFWAWVAIILVTLLAHETSHILAARLLGARLRIVLSGLGGQVHGLEERKVWQRVLILLAGPLGNGLILAILWAITDPQWNRLPIHRIGPDWTIFIANAVKIALLMNIFWIVLNVLPMWPLDGGRAAVEIGAALLGRRGQTLALLASLVVCLLLSLWVAQWARLKLSDRFDPGYPLYLFYVCTLILYCYFLWVSAFRALWGDPVPIDESSKSGRAA
jgi:stage IV sporulation protein FB